MDIPSWLIWLIDIVKQAAAILLVIVLLLRTQIIDAIIKRIQLSFDKALENKKTLNERKNYISKHRFDVEFQIYRELSQKFFLSRKLVLGLSCGQAGNLYDEEKFKELYDETFQTIESAQDILYGSAPFILENFFREYEEILQLLFNQLVAYGEKNKTIVYVTNDGERKVIKNNVEYANEVNSKLELLNNQIREYLSSLDTLD